MELVERTYKVELTVREGNDEWWEELNRMRARERRKEVAAEIARQLDYVGFADCKAKVVDVSEKTIRI